MHHVIEFHSHHATTLCFGKRQRQPQGQLLRIAAGMALLRLGEQELLLTEGDGCWLPADCLAAFTPLRDCHWQQVLISRRLMQPAVSGWLESTPLLDALLEQLASWQEEKSWQGPYGDRLRVLADELMRQPLQMQGRPHPLQQEWQQLLRGEAPLEASEQLAQLALQWRLLRADRLLKGGQKMDGVLRQLGYRDELQWQQDLQWWQRE